MSKAWKVGLSAGIGALLVIVAAVGALWYFVLRDDAPPPPSLPDREIAAEENADAEIDGTWVVAEGTEAAPVFVGYRVEELFAGNTIKSTAVGRTPAVTGTMTITGGQVTAVDVVADVQQLTSDQDRRDNFITDNALQTNTFPESTFVLTAPIDLDAIPEIGETVTTPAIGDLTLHGVTRTIELELEARWNGDVIDINGLVPIAFADYEISTPTIPGLVTANDNGQMEFQLVFARA